MSPGEKRQTRSLAGGAGVQEEPPRKKREAVQVYGTTSGVDGGDAATATVSAEAPSQFVQAPDAIPQEVALEQLSVDDLCMAVTRDYGVTAADAQILKDQNIDGRALLELGTKTDLEDLKDKVTIGGIVKLRRAVAASRPGPQSVVGDEYDGVFVNREKEVSSIFVLNVENNFVAGQGKTVLGKEYTRQLSKPEPRSHIAEALRELEAWHPGITSYGLRQLDAMANNAIRIRVQLSRGSPNMEVFFRDLAFALCRSVDQAEPLTNHEEVCRILLGKILSDVPMVLIVDEIGLLGSHENFTRLCHWLASFLERTHRNPLHIFMCGWTPFLLDLVPCGRMRSPVRHKKIYLEPLRACHVREMASHPKHGKCSPLTAEICEYITYVTGGVPRLVTLILKELSVQLGAQQMTHPVSKADIYAIAKGIVNDMDYRAFFISLKADALAQFARLAAIEELELVLGPDDADRLRAANMPVLLLRVGITDDRRVRCCRLYFELFRKQIDQLEESVINLAGLQAMVEGKGAARENEVLGYLQRRLVKRLLVSSNGDFVARAAGAPFTTTLRDWLGIFLSVVADVRPESHIAAALYYSDKEVLCASGGDNKVVAGADDDPDERMRGGQVGDAGEIRAEVLSGDSQAQSAEGAKPSDGQKVLSWWNGLIDQEILTYFKPYQISCRAGSVGSGAKMTPHTAWKRLQEAYDKEELKQEAASIMVPPGESHSPDIFVRLPPSCELRLISFQAKAWKLGTSKNAVSVGVIKEDCLRKLPQTVPGKQLHLLLAEVVTKQLRQLIGKQFLVIRGGKGSDPGWVSSPLLSDEEWLASESNEAAGRTLRECAKALPEGAVIAVMVSEPFVKALLQHLEP